MLHQFLTKPVLDFKVVGLAIIMRRRRRRRNGVIDRD